MLFVSFVRTIQFAAQSLWRNVWLSVVTVFILVLTLLSISLVSSVNLIASQAVDAVREKVDVSVFFRTDVAEEDIVRVKGELESLPEVKTVRYVTKEQALADFLARHSSDKEIAEALAVLEGNPLSPHFIVKANALEEYPTIIAFFESPERSKLVEDTRRDFEDSEKVVSRLSGISQRAKQIGIVVSAVFVVVSLLVVFNTIRITIYTHREEIGIMKLVGATDGFVRAPFLVESFIYAVLAVVISLAVFSPLLRLATPAISRYFADYGLDVAAYFTSRFWGILLWQFGLAVALTAVSSAIAIRRYLRV